MDKTIPWWNQRLFWGIRVWELLAFIALHVFLGSLYILTLLLTVSQFQVQNTVLNHALKIILTAPFWWFFFKKIDHWPLQKKVWLHLPASILYVGIWITVFYAIIDWLGMGRLRDEGIWWDVYIPLLIYFIQFSIFHVYAYWQQTLRQQAKEKELIQLAHTAELMVLKAQIQPHFLFNTLNSISSGLSPQEEKSRALIARLADVFRFAMNVTDKEFVPLEKEIEFIRNYLTLEESRFGDRLTVSYDIDPTLSDFPFPALLLQPLVENAIKHGIAKSLEGGHIHVQITDEGSAIAVTLSDTGRGWQEPKTSGGIGLENTRKRLDRLYQSPLIIEALQPKGCRVYFTIPKNKSLA